MLFLLGCLVGVSGTLVLLFLGSCCLYVLTGAQERDTEATEAPRLSVVR